MVALAFGCVGRRRRARRSSRPGVSGSNLPYLVSVLAAPVAQTCSLLYRRFLTCHLSAASNVLPITNRRYGRLKICATVNRHSPLGRGRSSADFRPYLRRSLPSQYALNTGELPHCSIRWRALHYPDASALAKRMDCARLAGAIPWPGMRSGKGNCCGQYRYPERQSEGQSPPLLDSSR